jgi:hypothetical protein
MDSAQKEDHLWQWSRQAGIQDPAGLQQVFAFKGIRLLILQRFISLLLLSSWHLLMLLLLLQLQEPFHQHLARLHCNEGTTGSQVCKLRVAELYDRSRICLHNVLNLAAPGRDHQNSTDS